MRIAKTTVLICGLIFCLTTLMWRAKSASAIAAVTVCGTVTQYTSATLLSTGSISIGGTSFTIAPATSLIGEGQISIGAERDETLIANTGACGNWNGRAANRNRAAASPIRGSIGCDYTADMNRAGYAYID